MSETRKCVLCGAGSPADCAGSADRTTDWREPCGPFVRSAAPLAAERGDDEPDEAYLLAQEYLDYFAGMNPDHLTQGERDSRKIAEAYLALRARPALPAYGNVDAQTKDSYIGQVGVSRIGND